MTKLKVLKQLRVEKNHKFPGWWTLYDKDDKPITSSTTYATVQCRLQRILVEKFEQIKHANHPALTRRLCKH